MKSVGTTYWNSPNKGATNESGFSVLPGGFRHIDGSFNCVRDRALFWSTTESSSNFAWFRQLVNVSPIMYRENASKSFGASVRCFRANLDYFGGQRSKNSQ
jgi:uncharacterized protein (TIGR02145 family)